MSSFVYQIERNNVDEGQKITTYTVSNKKTKTNENVYPYTLYVKEEHFKTLNVNSDTIILADEYFFNKNDEKILKLSINNKELYDYLVKNFKECEYELYEEDIPLEHQLLIEEKIKLSSGKKEDINFTLLSLDIETIGEVDNQNIVLISTYSAPNSPFNKVYIAEEFLDEKKKEKIISASFTDFKLEICKTEKELLESIKSDILELSPQIIIGWNVIDFDFAVIKRKMEFHEIPFNFSNFEGSAKMRIAKEFFGKSSLSFPGIIVFDIIQLLKTNFIEFEDYKLNTVASAVLEDEKIDLNDNGDGNNGIENKINAIEQMLHYDPITLIEYNFKDSLLTYKIVEKLKLIELMVERSLITNTPLVKVQSPIANLDIMYLRELKKKKYVAKAHYNFSQSSSIEGAYVMTPIMNFYEDVYVLDFKSLYPSIIMTFNIDPFTFNENGEIKAPNGAQFSRDKGILPELIETLFEEREKAKKANDSVKSFALKITMNSFYGAIASPKSRFYNKEIGEAITAFGRDLLHKAKEFVEKNSLGEVVYGDTDSIFLKANQSFSSLKDKKTFGKKVESELNEFFKNWCSDKFRVESKLTIEMEKIFSKFFIASKKRYVGFDELTGKNQFVGLEAVRGDWTELARNFQVKLVELLFRDASKEDIKKFFRDECAKLKNGEYDDLVVYRKKISKPLDQYTKTTPPHVKAAREVSGFSGKNVEYVITKDGPRHISLLEDSDVIDYDHYIDKQIRGVSDDFLAVLQLDFDEITNRRTQKSLERFF